MGHEHRSTDHSGHGHGARAASRRALWLALVVLTLFLVVEFVGGLWSGSLALMSDAGHLLTDVAAVVLALVAQWLALRPASAQRSYGYKRVEILAALFNGITLGVVAVLVGLEAVRRFDAPPQVQTGPMIVIAAVGLLAQLIVSAVLARAQHESLNVRGAYVHALTDALQSVSVVVAGLLMRFTGAYWIDPLASLLIAVLILWGGGRLVLEASHVLIEGTPREVDLDQVLQSMLGVAGVQRITDLHAWALTTGDNSLSAHVVAVEELDAGERENLRCQLDDVLRSRFQIQHVTLQVEHACTLAERCRCAEWMPPAPGHVNGEHA
ncbi:MAG: cation diffusion facilitator family transporter [Pseudomonadota bacterium]